MPIQWKSNKGHGVDGNTGAGPRDCAFGIACVRAGNETITRGSARADLRDALLALPVNVVEVDLLGGIDGLYGSQKAAIRSQKGVLAGNEMGKAGRH